MWAVYRQDAHGTRYFVEEYYHKGWAQRVADMLNSQEKHKQFYLVAKYY